MSRALLYHTASSLQIYHHAIRNVRRSSVTLLCRSVAGSSACHREPSKLMRPSPPSLSREEQQEFEDLLRKAQTPLSTKEDLAFHTDSPRSDKADFDGNVNPETGEEGGPKTEPVQQWGQGEGDWSFKGRVSDF